MSFAIFVDDAGKSMKSFEWFNPGQESAETRRIDVLRLISQKKNGNLKE